MRTARDILAGFFESAAIATRDDDLGGSWADDMSRCFAAETSSCASDNDDFTGEAVFRVRRRDEQLRVQELEEGRRH